MIQEHSREVLIALDELHSVELEKSEGQMIFSETVQEASIDELDGDLSEFLVEI